MYACLSVHFCIPVSVWLSVRQRVLKYICHFRPPEIEICAYMSVCVRHCLSVCLSVCMSVCMSVCLSVYLRVCLSSCLHVCMFVLLSVYLSLCLSVCLSVCPHVCLSVFFMSACLFVCLSLTLPAQSEPNLSSTWNNIYRNHSTTEEWMHTGHNTRVPPPTDRAQVTSLGRHTWQARSPCPSTRGVAYVFVLCGVGEGGRDRERERAERARK